MSRALLAFELRARKWRMAQEFNLLWFYPGFRLARGPLSVRAAIREKGRPAGRPELPRLSKTHQAFLDLAGLAFTLHCLHWA